MGFLGILLFFREDMVVFWSTLVYFYHKVLHFYSGIPYLIYGTICVEVVPS
jgi:hypothetical protein